MEKYLDCIKELMNQYQKDGIEIIGLFGSVARGDDDIGSDIDIAYKINYDKFFSIYKDGFSQILRLEEIKEELQKRLHKKVDFVPFNEKMKDEMIYV
jgi:predicted nucleotidyltransferase